MLSSSISLFSSKSSSKQLGYLNPMLETWYCQEVLGIGGHGKTLRPSGEYEEEQAGVWMNCLVNYPEISFHSSRGRRLSIL